MAITQRTGSHPATRGTGPAPDASPPSTPRRRIPGLRPLTSPGQMAVIYRWGAWALALGLIASGSTSVYGKQWAHNTDVYLLVGLTGAVNVLLTLGLRLYMRLMRRFPWVMVLDVLFCLGVYSRSNIWSSPFQFYSYASLMLPVTLFFFRGALAGSLLYMALDLLLLYGANDSFAWAQAKGQADTYLMQLAVVPLLAFVFAYPNRLYAQLRRAQQRLDIVEREQLLAVERTRIAQSLHDSVAQMLFGIRMLAESALARLLEQGAAGGAPAAGVAGGEQDNVLDRAPLVEVLRQVRDLAMRGNNEMRRSIYALNEPEPSRRGLAVSLRAMLADLAARTGIDTQLDVPSADGEQTEQPGEPERERSDADEPAEPSLPGPVAEALYKVAREALANVEKHADAMHVWVDLRLDSAAQPGERHFARLVVRDDGRGFRRPLLAQPGEPDEDDLGTLHFGLGNMRRAVEAVGGRLEVTTGLGRGTTVVASAPIP